MSDFVCVRALTRVLHGGGRLVHGRGHPQEDLLPPGDPAGGRDLGRRRAYGVAAAGRQGPLPALPITDGPEITSQSPINHQTTTTTSQSPDNCHTNSSQPLTQQQTSTEVFQSTSQVCNFVRLIYT